MVVRSKRRLAFLAVVVSVVFSFTIQVHASDRTPKVYRGEYIVRVADSSPLLQQFDTNRHTKRGRKVKERRLRDGKKIALYSDSTKVSFRSLVPGAAPNADLVDFDSYEASDFCRQLALEVPLESCEPNGYVEIEAIPEDSLYEDLYAMGKIRAPEAWEQTTGSKLVTIAVLDTGVDYTHPDLAANMWKNSSEIPNNGIDDDNNGYVDDYYGYDFMNNDGDPYDDNGHGTHVAGTIGATGNNSEGVVGVNWNTRIMALKFLGAGGGGSILDAITALDFAVAHEVDVINASFGSTVPSSEFEKAIRRTRDAGVFFVAAAGNSSKNTDAVPHYPSGYDIDSIISVAATDSSDNLAHFSNYGLSTVDLAAPGVQILSTYPGGKYAKLSGTSMAAPHVAGLAGLILAKNPEFTSAQLKNALTTSVDQLLSLEGVVTTSGRINALKAINSDGKGSAPEPIVRPSVSVKTFGHRRFRKTLFKRRNFRMVFSGEPGAQFNAQLELSGIFDGSCSLGTYQLPNSGVLRMQARLNLRNWMWYTKSIALSTGTDVVSRGVKSQKALRNKRLRRYTRHNARMKSKQLKKLGIENSYAEASCESILSSLKVK